MKVSDRIPAEQSRTFSRWELPEVNEGQIIQAEKTRQKVARGKAPEIDRGMVVYNRLTVGQIEEISQRIHEDIHREAYQEGLKQGQTKGYQAGLEEGQHLIQQQLSSLQAVIGQLSDILQSQDDAVEQALASLSISVAESVLHRELLLDSSHINDIIREAIAAINLETDKVAVYLSPQDYQLLTEQGQVDEQWKLHSDQTLTPGGCRISNQYSVVDFTTESQFQQTVSQWVEPRFAALARQKHARESSPSSSPGSSE